MPDETLQINSSTDMLLYKILDTLCYQSSELQQMVAANQTLTSVLPSLVQAPAQPLSNDSTVTVNNINQTAGNPQNGAPTGYVATSNYPIPVFKINPTLSVQGSQAILYPNAIKIVAPGTMQLSVCLDTSSAGLPSYPLISRDNGVTWAALNLAQNMTLGVEYQFSVMLFPKDIFDISFSQISVIRYLRMAYILSM